MPTLADRLLRDYIRYTGDGLPGEPIGHPLPVGDPASGVYTPAKADFRASLNSATDAADLAQAAATAAQAYAGIATGTPQFATAAEVAAVTLPAFTDVILVGDRIYVRDDTDGAVASSDGKRWSSLDFSGRFERMQGDMLQGSTVTLIAYGDSTTDGNGTTGWTANPVDGSGNALGTASHAPPNAWPAQAQPALRSMFSNQNIFVRNAGYSGKQLQEGWAYNNFTAAMAPYSAPTAVMIGFGINDVRQAYFSLADFETQLLLLCRRIARTGAFPIFILPDEPADEQHNGWLLGKVRAVYQSVAARTGVKIIDWGGAISDLAQCSDASAFRWAADQPDDTHGNDSWHSVKGGFIAASIYPHTLWVDKPIMDVAPWSKYCKPIDGYTVFQGTTNKFGASIVVPAGSYALDQYLLDMWVWSVGAARAMYWASVDGNGFWSPRSTANAPRIGLYDYTSKAAQTIIAPGSGGAVQPTGGRDAEAMGLAYRVPQGLSRWAFRAPRDNTSNDVYLGYFSIREVRPQFAIAEPVFAATASPRIIDRDSEGDVPQVLGFGSGRETNLALTVDIQPGMGVALWACRVYSGSTTRENNRKRGLFLFRHATDDRLFLYSAIFDADGSIGSSTSLGSSGALTWSGARRLRLSAGVDGSGQYIRVYDGWQSNTPVITATNALTNAPLPWGGTPGAVWQHTGAVGVAAMTIYGEV